VNVTQGFSEGLAFRDAHSMAIVQGSAIGGIEISFMTKGAVGELFMSLEDNPFPCRFVLRFSSIDLVTIFFHI